MREISIGGRLHGESEARQKVMQKEIQRTQNLLRIGKDIDSDRRSKDMQVSDNGTPPRC